MTQGPGIGKKPVIVVVDDDLDEMSATLALLAKAACGVRPREPDDVTADDLEAADLVLVDWRLDRWDRRADENKPIAVRPLDGLALAEVLRSHLGPRHAGRPTAFALHSGALDQLRLGVPETIQEFALARIHNLEWVFAKGGTGTLVPRFVSLGRALRGLPHPWPPDLREGQRALTTLLAMPDDPLAAQSVLDCHPPLHELARNSNGLTIIRWLAQRILPYPTFLLDEWYVAARLGVAVGALRDDLAGGGAISQLLAPCLYTGALADFIEARWWRTRIDDLLWQLTEGGAPGSLRVQEAIRSLAPDVQLLDVSTPVVCVDDKYRANVIVDAEDAVRIDLDDRPPFALAAWTTSDLARSDDGVRARVIPADRDRVET